MAKDQYAVRRVVLAAMTVARIAAAAKQQVYAPGSRLVEVFLKRRQKRDDGSRQQSNPPSPKEAPDPNDHHDA